MQSECEGLRMHCYTKAVEKLMSIRLFFHYSDGRNTSVVHTASTTHGGFYNNPATTNSVLKTVRCKPTVTYPFTQESLEN